MSFLTGIKVPRKTLLNDLKVGLQMALVNVPGGLANGLLAGVNPIFGLYSMIAGTSVAALFTSSVIMNVDSTSATALAALDALGGIPETEVLASMVVLGLLVGGFMILFGFLNLGSLMRFISAAVMTGFISGLGVLTILGQVGDLTGYYSEANNKVIRTIDTILNPQQIDLATLLVGLSTIVIIMIVNRTRFEKFSLLVGVLLTTVMVAVINPSTVAIVGDTTEIPRSLPNLNLPDLSLILAMIVPALTIAVIALVQAAGVSSNTPNPDGKFPNPSGDFKGQGAANLAVGLVGGVPVGGSVSGTIMIQNMGGKSRWANLFTGIFAGVAMLLIAPFIERIPMATLAGLLITVGFSMVNKHRIRMVWNTDMSAGLVMVISFVATLIIPLQAAVGLGVMLHILLFVFKSANLMRIERIVVQSDGTYLEAEVPAELPSNEIVMLEPSGSLFFAGAAEFDSNLPNVGDAHHVVVIIRLRHQDAVSSTFILSLERYTRMLHAQDNLLILSGLNPQVVEQLEDTELNDLVGEGNIFPAQPQFGAAAEQALARAENWQTKKKE